MAFLKRIDALIYLIIGAVIVAVLLPARGGFADIVDVGTKVIIAVLFFLYGARLSARDALQGLTNWRLHGLILAFTFLVFPVIGLGLSQIMPGHLALGVLYLTLVPSTVNSSVIFTSIARGNVAGAIVAATTSNLLGVILTPTLVFLLMSRTGAFSIDAGVFLDIGLQLLAPFIAGQLLRRWVASIAQSKITTVVDKSTVTLVVYSAFSAGIVEGVWSVVSVGDIAVLIVVALSLVCFILWLTYAVATRLGLPRGDVIATMFCGTKKSLASGLPMSSVIFSGGGAGLIIVPLMLFHQIQLFCCSWLAPRLAEAKTREE